MKISDYILQDYMKAAKRIQLALVNKITVSKTTIRSLKSLGILKKNPQIYHYLVGTTHYCKYANDARAIHLFRCFLAGKKYYECETKINKYRLDILLIPLLVKEQVTWIGNDFLKLFKQWLSSDFSMYDKVTIISSKE